LLADAGLPTATAAMEPIFADITPGRFAWILGNAQRVHAVDSFARQQQFPEVSTVALPAVAAR
jgi:hypothetical protein